MKILHILTEDSYGAGRAATRISRALSQMGLDSTVLVLKPDSHSSNKGLSLSKFEKIIYRASLELNERLNPPAKLGRLEEDVAGVRK